MTTNHQSQKILYKEPPQLNLINLEIPKKLTQKWKMAMSEVMMKISTASLGKCRRLTSEDASKIDWLQQTETQKKGYMVECLITTPRGKELHLLLSHLWLKPRLVKGWHIVSLLCVTEFELQKWIADRRQLPGGLANFYEMNEYNTALESADWRCRCVIWSGEVSFDWINRILNCHYNYSHVYDAHHSSTLYIVLIVLTIYPSLTHSQLSFYPLIASLFISNTWSNLLCLTHSQLSM